MSATDDDRLGAAFDPRVTRRLLRFALPHARLFVLAAALVAVSSALDLTVPWLTKLAIDRCVLPTATMVELPRDDRLRAELLARGASDLGDGRLVLGRMALSPAETAALRARGGSAVRCVPAPIDEAPSGAPVADGRAWVTDAMLAALPEPRRVALRRPQLEFLRTLGVVLIAVLVVRMLAGYAQSLTLQQAGNLVMADLREAVFGRLLRLPVRYFDRNAVGRLVTRATNDVAAVNELFTSVMVYLLKDAAVIVGVLGIMIAVDWRLALAVLAVSPFVVWVSWDFRKRARDAYRGIRRALGRLNAYLQEGVTGMRAIQAAGAQARSQAAYDRINDEEYRASMRQLVIYGVFMPLISFGGVVALAVIIWYGGHGVAAGTVTVGALVAFTAYVEMLFAPLRDLAEKHNVLQAANASAERIFQVLDEPPEDAGGGVVPDACAGAIEFQDVWFAYDGDHAAGEASGTEANGQPRWVLKGVSFTVPAGGRLALVGPTGSGKTTVVSLLMRFHDPQRGRVLLDGRDVRELDLRWLRRRLAVVLQDVFLFAGNVRANIALKGSDIPDAAVEAAARATHADAVIARLPGGYASELNERGTQLSSGERQLLAFARALAAQPAVLVLDEATASIDSQTERLVQEGLERLLAGRTSITIAHRLSTVREATEILALTHGEIVERGTHAQLVARNGLYAALLRRQRAAEEAGLPGA